jgi:hypothetical protein
MKRTRSQLASDTGGDSDVEPTSGDAQGSSALHRTASTSKRKVPATKDVSEPLFSNITQLVRPSWPANDEITPEMSLRKIKELESGNDEEKLMAVFARHVIKPGRNKRGGCWVSKRSLKKAFPEHFNQQGFVSDSTWKSSKRASDFGLPTLFFRGIDEQRALLSPHEFVKDMIRDLGYMPATEPLTSDEHQWLRQRDPWDDQDSSVNTEQRRTYATPGLISQGIQDETDLDAGEDGGNIARLSEQLQSVPSVGSQSRSHTEPPVVPEVKPSRIKLEAMISVLSEHETPPHGVVQSTPSTTDPEASQTHTTMQQDNNQGQKEQPDNASKTAESAEPPVAKNDMRAIRTILIPMICDILKDFPTAPDDESFLPLLRQLVKATVANLPRAMEEKHLDLATHVIVHCTSSPSTDQVEAANIVRPVLRILSKHRQRMTADTHSQLQRELSNAAKANDLEKLRAKHAQLLLLEARYEEGQDEQ